MIRQLPDYDPSAPVIVIDIGNTTISMGTWFKDQVKSPLNIPTQDPTAFNDTFTAHLDSTPNDQAVAVIIASVVPDVLERIRVMVLAITEKDALVIGDNIPLPMEVDVKDAKTIGADRVCQAAAAFEQIKTGCTVISLGTAVTVDLVNDEGVLLGGAILPGLKIQLQSLHEHTAVLPEAPLEFPPLPYGRNTIEAIQTGVCRGLVGTIRGIVEGYASHLSRWPHVIATGGDVEIIQPHCDFVDTFVTHLSLRGIGLAYTKYLVDSGV